MHICFYRTTFYCFVYKLEQHENDQLFMAHPVYPQGTMYLRGIVQVPVDTDTEEVGGSYICFYLFISRSVTYRGKITIVRLDAL